MRHFPIFLDLKGRPVLVVGAGRIAEAKAEQLAQAGAFVRRVDLFDEIGDAVLVVCADPAQGEIVADAARAAKVPVNVVDRPALCDFLWPSIVDRAPVTIAICTSGTSPVLARHLRTRIELAVPVAIGRLADFAGRLRARVARAIPDLGARRSFWDRILSGPAAARAMAGDETGAVRELDRALLGAASPYGRVGFVAMSDDPDMLTLRAVRLLQDADVVLHPAEIDREFLNLVRRDAECAVAAKPAVAIAAARSGRRVIWLGAGPDAIAAVTAAGIETILVASADREHARSASSRLTQI